MAFKFLLLVVVGVLLKEASGHGMMLDPPNRSSLWRFDPTSPPNYSDNENFCGGINVLWGIHKGKCGVCGDPYDQPHPQENENTGKYGEGKVVATYKSGQTITTNIKLSSNHMGTFEYSLCILSNPKTYEPENCFTALQFEDGSTKYKVPGSTFQFTNRVKLPAGVKCERCVLRWIYTGGNNWGPCEDGSHGLGCGPQESFRSCSDIAIQ